MRLEACAALNTLATFHFHDEPIGNAKVELVLRGSLRCGELTQHRRQDASVAVVLDLHRSVKA